MARIGAINPRFDDESRKIVEFAEKTQAPGPALYEILAHNPEVMKGFARAWNAAFYGDKVDHVLKEVVRIAMVNVHACGYCTVVRSTVAKEMGITEEKIRAVGDYETSPLFTPRERAAIKYATIFSTDLAKAKDPQVYAEFRKHFKDDDEAVELETFMAITEGFGKLVATWGLIPDKCEIPAAPNATARRH